MKRIKIALLAGLAGLALSGAPALADPAGAEAPRYVVLEQNARVPFFSQMLRGYSVARDDSILLEGGHGRWYRATLDQPCGRAAAFEAQLRFETRPDDTLDRFAVVYIDGMRCPLRSLDRIEPPPSGEPS